MNTKRAGLLQRNLLFPFAGVLILLGFVFVFVVFRGRGVQPQNGVTKTKVELQKKGMLKDITILPTAITPDTITIDKGDYVNISNTTSEKVKLKINMYGGIVQIIPAGKSVVLSNFNESKTYELQNEDNPSVKGKIIVK